jgi:hypothetical protein
MPVEPYHALKAMAEALDTTLIEAAIQKAIAAGACAAPAMYPSATPPYDIDLVRARTTVNFIQEEGLSAYVSDLQRDPQMRRFDDMFATLAIGDPIRVSLRTVANMLLADAISSGDIAQTVARFRSYLGKNRARVMAVMAVQGVRSDEEVSLGPDIRLVPINSIPPSVQRGASLGQPFVQFVTDPFPIRSVLITEFEFGPIFYLKGQLKGQGNKEAQAGVANALAELNQARCLFSLFGAPTAFRRAWVQPTDWLMSAVIGDATFVGEDSPLFPRALIDPEDAMRLASSYFAIDNSRRHDVLRIPLDRLDRAGRVRDLADTSIDLGIALEALLLHDLEDDRGELRFRLSLRGAWLAGGDETERAEIQKILRKVYDLRSKAVHAGSVPRTDQNAATISSGLDLCKRLIRKAIEANAAIAWDRLVLGGPVSRV